MNRTFISANRFVIVVLALVVTFCGVGVRLWYLHVHKQDDFRELAERSRQRTMIVPARRGNIIDRNGNLLASNRSLMRVGLDPQVVTSMDPDAKAQLATLLAIPEARIDAAIQRKYFKTTAEDGRTLLEKVQWVKLHDGVDELTYEAIRELGIKGVYGNRRFTRYYPYASMAAHVLGFQNLDGYGLGIEHCMDFYLRGQAGWREGERDGRRREMAQFRRRDVAPSDGLHVALTLDAMIQHFVEVEVERLVSEYDPEGISIIVSHPRTGELLAMANYPSFSPAAYWEASADSYRNRALTDIYEPGSTFKIVPVAGALSAEVVAVDDHFDCNLPVAKYHGHTYRLPRDSHPIGEASVATILYKSSNRGSSHLGILLGRQRLYDVAQKFGFGEPTGLCLSAEFLPLENWEGATGEIGGILHAPDKWDGLTITRLPMGHAVSATPMQVHMAMSTIANGGILMQPQLVKRVLDTEGRVVLSFPIKKKHRAIDAQAARQVSAILEKVVLPGGTAKRANLPGYGVAGKTGTTKKIINGQYSNQHHVASFSGYLPAWNPQVAITVVVDEPQLDGTGYGGVVAAPAFRNIAQNCVQYLGIASRSEDANLLAANHRVEGDVDVAP